MAPSDGAETPTKLAPTAKEPYMSSLFAGPVVPIPTSPSAAIVTPAAAEVAPPLGLNLNPLLVDAANYMWSLDLAKILW